MWFPDIWGRKFPTKKTYKITKPLGGGPFDSGGGPPYTLSTLFTQSALPTLSAPTSLRPPCTYRCPDRDTCRSRDLSPHKCCRADRATTRTHRCRRRSDVPRGPSRSRTGRSRPGWRTSRPPYTASASRIRLCPSRNALPASLHSRQHGARRGQAGLGRPGAAATLTLTAIWTDVILELDLMITFCSAIEGHNVMINAI